MHRSRSSCRLPRKSWRNRLSLGLTLSSLRSSGILLPVALAPAPVHEHDARARHGAYWRRNLRYVLVLLAVWFGLQFLTSPNSGVAWAAHVGGFVFGCAIALLVRSVGFAQRLAWRLMRWRLERLDLGRTIARRRDGAA